MIADQPHSLSQSPLEKDFEAGVHFGIGGFNLVSGTDGISAEINNYSTGTHWIWDDRQPKLAIIISYPTSASGIIVSLKKMPQNVGKSYQNYCIRTNEMLHCTKTLLVLLVFMHTHRIKAYNPWWLSQW